VAVGTGERNAFLHFRDVGLWMEIVGIEKQPIQLLCGEAGDGGFSATRNAHDEVAGGHGFRR
jgi:hypothetical protein